MKKIEQLKLLATESAGPYLGKFDIDKFGILIVKECSKIIRNGGYWNPAFGEKRQCTPEEIAKMIEEWFGVDNDNN